MQRKAARHESQVRLVTCGPFARGFSPPTAIGLDREDESILIAVGMNVSAESASSVSNPDKVAPSSATIIPPSAAPPPGV
jgi:hypothetical protein